MPLRDENGLAVPYLACTLYRDLIRTEQTVMTDSKDNDTEDWKDRNTIEYIEYDTATT